MISRKYVEWNEFFLINKLALCKKLLRQVLQNSDKITFLASEVKLLFKFSHKVYTIQKRTRFSTTFVKITKPECIVAVFYNMIFNSQGKPSASEPDFFLQNRHDAFINTGVLERSRSKFRMNNGIWWNLGSNSNSVNVLIDNLR